MFTHTLSRDKNYESRKKEMTITQYGDYSLEEMVCLGVISADEYADMHKRRLAARHARCNPTGLTYDDFMKSPYPVSSSERLMILRDLKNAYDAGEITYAEYSNVLKYKILALAVA
jgi:hypothetical protein